VLSGWDNRGSITNWETVNRTVTYIVRTISAVYGHAVEDKVVTVNPAVRPGRFIKTGCRRDKVGFLTPEEGAAVLSTARKHYGKWYALFFTAFHTGMRQGELLGLQWGDIDWKSNFIEIRRSLWEGVPVTPKSGKSRRMDMSDGLATVLTAHRKAVAEEAIKAGRKMPEWAFPGPDGSPLDPGNVRRAFHSCLQKAKIRRVRFHDTRHCFASWLIGNGESLAYVRDQLGHHSIGITVDTYGHLVPGANREAVNRLSEILGPRVDPATEKALPNAV
jgi:integrase